MLPALTFTPRRLPMRRVASGAIALVLVACLALSGILVPASSTNESAAAVRPLTERLAASTWALAVPTAWLAAPLPDVRVGESVDLLAVRMGDRPLAVAIAADLRVMGVDERSVVFEVDEEAATAIAMARASGLLVVPLLRSAH